MTGWELPQELARIIVIVCLVLMFIGVLLIITSFSRSTNISKATMIQERAMRLEKQWQLDVVKLLLDGKERLRDLEKLSCQIGSADWVGATLEFQI